MRLVCPSCGAEYEVDDSVIPDTGRDVQCSNCGQAWFQVSAAQLQANEAGTATPDDSQIWAEPPRETNGEADSTPETDGNEADQETGGVVAEDARAPEAEDTPADLVQETSGEPAAGLRRRTLDDAVLNVLREEAAREARVRSKQGPTLETQPDLGLSSAAIAAFVANNEGTKDRVATTRGNVDEDDDIEALVSRGSRRELLPDIEEINSTLRATSERGGDAASKDAPETLRRRRSGFRLGFSISLISAAILVATYLLAPVIASQVPTLEPVLVRYVHGIDKARLWVDAKMQSSTEAMRNKGNGTN